LIIKVGKIFAQRAKIFVQWIHLRKQMNAISYNTHCFALFAFSALFALKSAHKLPTTLNPSKTSVSLCGLLSSVIKFKTNYLPHLTQAKPSCLSVASSPL